MSKNTFFITTPIYYSNWVPHIGHAYSSFIADTIARFERLQMKEVFFSTWVDENSQKVVESAVSLGMETLQYADMMAEKHKSVWDGIGIEYTDFIRTTENRHKDFVQEVLQKSYDNWDIYEGIYEWLYCVGCEAFKKESDLNLIDGKYICSDHPNKSLEHLKEKNYFFRLSKYQDRILDFYEKNPDFVSPRSRFNEIIEFVKWWLDDFSISRETNKFWITLPFDSDQVTYVWYDALFNYLTVCGDEKEKWWPANLHVIGKDIVKFHGIYWLAMLWSAGYEAPEKLLTTGHFTAEGQKMSKSLWNVIDPVEYCKNYSRDMLLLYLFTAFPIGEDGDFSHEQALLTFNAKLSNNLWNLLNRFIALSLKLDGKIHKEKEYSDEIIDSEKYLKSYFENMNAYNLKSALECAFEYSSEINKYVDTQAPWKIDITEENNRKNLEYILFILVSNLRRVTLMLLPFFPTKMNELLIRIGTPYEKGVSLAEQCEREIDSFTVLEKGEPLYMRLAK